MEETIKIVNVNKFYGDIHVLKDINLTINRREIVSVVGASGAGKSTLLHILGTLDKPDTGNVFYDDVDVNKLNDKALSEFRNKNIGFIFQFHHLLPEFTAMENVCIPAFIARIPRKTAEPAAVALLERLGLKNRMHHKPSQLSGGEQQRVAIARALINNPKIILADEPSGNLDSENADALHKLFFQLRDELEITCVIVTHNEHFADMADVKLKMTDGNLVNLQ